jgi:hypothetical protein
LYYVFLLLLISSLLSPAFISAAEQPLVTAPTFAMGLASFTLFSQVVTNYVEGQIQIRDMSIGDDYFPNGTLFGRGNASLQLNAMIGGKYWAQDVALFDQINSSYFEVTLIVNFWNLTGPVTLVGNTTTYEGLGVLYYVGPTLLVKLPLTLSLFMNSSGRLQFGYSIGDNSKVYYSMKSPGDFLIGGVSSLGLPNDLEFVWGGPGGGSVAQLSINSTAYLYYEQMGEEIIPQSVISVGLDTGESVSGVNVIANLSNLIAPSVEEFPGTGGPKVLWPVPPDFTLTMRNNTAVVNISFEGKPLSWQYVQLYELTVTGLKPLAAAYTINGTAVFNVSSSGIFVAYYPGNFTLSSTYRVSSPIINSFVTSLHNTYADLQNFLSSYQFKNGIKSVLHLKYHPSQGSSNYWILYVLALSAGILAAALADRVKKSQ